MARYIDLDDDEIIYCGNDGEYERYNIPTDIRTADVVEIVRCKDCRYKQLKNLTWFCPFGLPSGPDGYCSYGERRE